ncbi:hypothetical protein EJ02DRAFT_429636 [Clathrospora elynae]|uniref:BTB domain-containing protein n=1 Tax=Clathrospora elynae TaxID=706981 RepID=A0A6A5T7S8_9PLEO|nr:hypothetical protein EJ02DRAFT_429636 [Clathrospora elynae]
MPPPTPKHITPPPNATKAAHSEIFLDMIQGPAITIIIGPGPSAPVYTLPIALLCVNSLYFRTEITRLNSLTASNFHFSKKRKRSPEAVEKVDSDSDSDVTEEDEKTEKVDIVIRLPDVDPAIFGLFLKFIYQGSYPANVDGRTSANYHHHNVSSVATSMTPVSARYSPYTTTIYTSPYTNHDDKNNNVKQTAPGTFLPPTPPPPFRSPVTGPPQHTPPSIPYTDRIPFSIHAWLLAQRLGAMGFMNHCIGQIYAGLGVYFALTPALMHYVWAHTTPFLPFSSSSSSSSSFSLSPNSSPTTFTEKNTVLTTSPLRKLLLDVLVLHWSSSPSSTSSSSSSSSSSSNNNNNKKNNVIARSSSSNNPSSSASLNMAWDNLFDTHHDLRREFIFGLQGGVQLMGLGGYFATSGSMGQSVGVGVTVGGGGGGEKTKKREKDEDSVPREAGRAALGRGAMGEGGKGGAEAFDGVIVKKEINADVVKVDGGKAHGKGEVA